LKIIFEDCFLENAALVLLIRIFWFAPTICQYATEWWSSAQIYQDWCKDERVVSFKLEEIRLTKGFLFQSAGYTLTRTCSLIVDRQLPLPPGLGPVLKEMRVRGAEGLVIPPLDGFVRPWNREQADGKVVAPGATAWDIWKSRTDGELEWFERAMYYTFIRGSVGNGIHGCYLAFTCWCYHSRKPRKRVANGPSSPLSFINSKVH